MEDQAAFDCLRQVRTLHGILRWGRERVVGMSGAVLAVACLSLRLAVLLLLLLMVVVTHVLCLSLIHI